MTTSKLPLGSLIFGCILTFLLALLTPHAFAGCECPRNLRQPTKGACERKRSGRCISGWRDSRTQARLFRTLPRGQAARPGTSNHERGLAIDLSGTRQCPAGLKRLNSRRHKGTHCSPTGR